MRKIQLLAILLLVSIIRVNAQQIQSPDGQLNLSFELKANILIDELLKVRWYQFKKQKRLFRQLDQLKKDYHIKTN